MNRNIMKRLLKVNTRFLLINFTLELVTVNTNLDMVPDLTENNAENIRKIRKIRKIKIGSELFSTLSCTLPPVTK